MRRAAERRGQRGSVSGDSEAAPAEQAGLWGAGSLGHHEQSKEQEQGQMRPRSGAEWPLRLSAVTDCCLQLVVPGVLLPLRLILGIQTAIPNKSGWAGLSAAMMLALFLERVYLQFTALLRNSNVFLHNLKRFCQDIPSFQINPRSLPCASLLKFFHTRAVRIPNHQNISV